MTIPWTFYFPKPKELYLVECIIQRQKSYLPLETFKIRFLEEKKKGKKKCNLNFLWIFECESPLSTRKGFSNVIWIFEGDSPLSAIKKLSKI